MRDRERYEKRVGSVVDGRWRIERLLGWGSTSAVYEATHRNGHRSALKILHQSLCANRSATDRFLREAGIANGIKHRSIVPICDDGTTEDGCAYLVLDLLEGESLEELRERKNGRLEIEELAPIAEELMSAISAVHAAGVVHRDLKPQNVFLTKSGELKLLDFGTARIFDRSPGSPVSAAGMVNGTPAFMSPEQAKGSRAEVDAQSDVWSLGAMLFTTLSGEPVHAGKDAHACLLAAASREARKLAEVAPSVDDGVAAVIDRALAFAKADRWPDVRSMRIALRHAVLTAVPTLRDLAAYAPSAEDGASPDEPAAAGSNASGPTTDATFALVTPMESAVPVLTDTEHELLGVSSTQRRRRVSAGIPIPALVTGLGAMAAVILLVVFFKSGGDERSAHPASLPDEPVVTTAAEPPGLPAPAASFIVIEAPDDPITKQTQSKPAWATAPMPKKPAATTQADAGAAESPANSPAPPANSPPAEAPTAEPVGGGPITEQREPKGGPAPGVAREELP